MDTQNTQPNIDPNKVSAALAFATNLQSQSLPSPTSPANEPGAEQQPSTQEDVKTEISGLESRLMDELTTLRAEMKSQGDGQKELQDLKKQIEEILNSSE